MHAEKARAWTYTVSARELCEFTAKQGDLDRRFTPSATALEGMQGQQTVAQRRGADYETEIALETTIGPLRVRGRADGYDPRRRCLEEIKTLRGHPDEIPANRRQLHWAQLQTYGALFCRERGLEEVALALVYFDVASQSEVELRQIFGASELEAALQARCAAFAGWAEQEAQHRMARDTALQALPFPQAEFRQGQRRLAEAVYRTAARGGSLLAQAPTGIGKTLGTLFPLLRAMPLHSVDKIAYLTCKGTGRITALDALGALRSGTAATGGGALRVQAMVSKERGCEHPDKACHGDSCPLARGFYDRLPAARAEAVAQGWLDTAAQRQVALRHGVCPYYLGQELVRWADVMVGDVHHLFSAQGVLAGLAFALDWRLAVLVDEAHNLVDRARDMCSGELPLAPLRLAAQQAPAGAQGPLQNLLQAAQDLLASTDKPYSVLEEPPEPFTLALQAAAGSLSDHFHRHPLQLGPLLQFHFELKHFQRLADVLNDHSLFELHQGPGDPEGRLALRNVAPACFLRPRFAALHCSVLFSATLSPPSHAQRLLGLPDDTAWIDVPPAFPPEHLQVQVARGLSTRYAHRGRSLHQLVRVLASQFDAHPGNYLAFFSSFEYLDQAADLLARLRPDIPQWRQDRRMLPAARQDFLARFHPQHPQGQGIAFAVLGGVFAEGVDLPGRQLIGAFVATLGLPPVSPQQDQVTARLQKLFGTGPADAELIPAMQKVVQAAGRVLRTPQDRGWLWLLDDRYTRADVVALLPPWWGMRAGG